MKLGISYMVFDGIELLEAAIRSVRSEVDFVSVFYQTKSYHQGFPAEPELVPLIVRLSAEGLIDKAVHYVPDLSLRPKQNELILRNFGLAASRDAGCTHHISSDVDEFSVASELAYVKREMEAGGYDSSIVEQSFYYRHPQFQIVPDPPFVVSFIHPVTTCYASLLDYPYRIELTRRLTPFENCRVFKREEFTLHHFAYVRKDINRKLQNNSNKKLIGNLKKYVSDFDKYQVGERLRIPPDFIPRRTKLVPNTFNIEGFTWEHHPLRASAQEHPTN